MQASSHGLGQGDSRPTRAHSRLRSTRTIDASEFTQGVLPNTSKVAGILGTIWGFAGLAETIVFYLYRGRFHRDYKGSAYMALNDRAIGKLTSNVDGSRGAVLIVVPRYWSVGSEEIRQSVVGEKMK